MKIKALAPWFGSKRTLAPAIIAELGPHRAYWEPFCGSMAVLLEKPPATMETVGDLHGDLINLARVIQSDIDGPKLYRRLRRTVMHEAIYDEAREALSREASCPVDRAWAYFVASWLGRNGMAGLPDNRTGKAFCVRYTKNGGHGATRFLGCVDSIPAFRRRIRQVTILHRDAFAVIARIEDAGGVVIYIDAPYFAKALDYAHDLTHDDQRRLAGLLGRFKKTRVVVSYYDHPLLDELYAGWTRRTFDVSKATANQTRRGTNETRATEVLLINGPSLVAADKSAMELFT
jgi:DNA adenine methylase